MQNRPRRPMHTSTLTSTSALERVAGQRHDPTLPPGKTRYPLYKKLGGPRGRCGRVRKMSPPPGFDPRTVQPVASCYTDWATRSTKYRGTGLKYKDGQEDGNEFFSTGKHSNQSCGLLQGTRLPRSITVSYRTAHNTELLPLSLVSQFCLNRLTNTSRFLGKIWSRGLRHHRERMMPFC